jgi:Tfp pilus assembly protein PilF/photosystem II stability/assembly factor-like uncharacterized protein
VDSDFIENPYIVGNPVSGPDLYGRDRELGFILDALGAHDHTPVLLHGQRRIGKSSILTHLRFETLPVRAIASVYIDLQNYMALSGTAEAKFNQILEGIAEAFESELAFTLPPRSANTSWEAYFAEDLVPAVSQATGSRLFAVLVDEFDSLPDFEESSGTMGQESTAHRLMALFNNLSSREELAIRFVVVVGRQFDHLPQSIRALLTKARAQNIWLLSENKTHELIKRPVEKLPIDYQPDALDRIYQLTQGHPYFTQAICSKIFQNLVRSGRKTVTAANVDDVLETVLVSASTGFTWLWDELSATRKLILAATAEFEPEHGPATIEDIGNTLREHHLHREDLALADELAYLAQHKTLEQTDSPGSPTRYRVSIELVRLWVKERNSIGDLKHRMANLNPEADKAFQRATLLYVETDPEKAQQELEHAVKLNPYHLNAQIALGDALQRVGDYQAAIKAYQAACALGADRAEGSLIEAFLTFIANLEGQKKYSEASALYREVLALGLDEPTITQKLAEWFEKGQRAHRKRDWPKAIQYLQRVVEIKADYQEGQANQLLEEARIPASLTSPPKWPWLVARCGAILLLTIGLLLVTGFGRYLVGAIGLITRTPTNTPTLSTPPTQTPVYIVVTATSTQTATPTNTPAPSHTPVPIGQPTPTRTTTPTASATPTDTATPTPIPTQPPEAPPNTPTPYIIEITATPTPTPLALDLPAGRALDVALLDVSNGARAVAVIAGKGIFQTEDKGHRWEPLWEPDDSPFAVDSASFLDIEVAPSNAGSIYVGGFEYVIYSHDRGESWDISVSTRNKPGTLPNRAQVYSLAAGYQDPMLVFAATEEGVFRSRDGGETWQALDRIKGDIFTNDAVFSVFIDPNSSDKVVYAAGTGDRILFTDTVDQDKVYWEVTICDECESAIYALARAPDGAILAGGAGSGGIVAKRAADELRWTRSRWGIRTPQAPSLVISNLVFDPADPAVIYAGTGSWDNAKANGIYRSQDGGATWHTLNNGLTIHEGSAPYVQGIAAAEDGTLLIATHDGVYRLNVDDNTWEKE